MHKQSEDPNPPIASEKVLAGRKTFFIDLKENDKGRYIKLSERAAHRRDTVVIPGNHAEEVAQAILTLINHGK